MRGLKPRLVSNVRLSRVLSNIMRMEDPEAVRDAHEAHWQVLEALEARADELGILDADDDEETGDDGGWGCDFSTS